MFGKEQPAKDITENKGDAHRFGATTGYGDSGSPDSRLEFQTAPAANAIDNRYQLRGEIARGGMGVIWRATDVTLGREVAVKLLQERYSTGSATARRFADEAQITAQLQHPAIPPVHDFGILRDGRPLLAMKLIKGHTLEDLLAARLAPSKDRGRFVAAFEQICQALAYAHAHKVIHRDLKPHNIMVGSFGEVQVMDWGLAKVITGETLPNEATDTDETRCATQVRGSDTDKSKDSFTQVGSILGTLAYMPPEQAAGELARLGPHTDVFGLGAILAVILTGHPPYVSHNSETLRIMAIRGDVAACFSRLDDCGGEQELIALCKKCLAFDLSERPSDAGVVAIEISRLRAATEERARVAEQQRAAAEARAIEQRKKRRWQVAVAASLLAIVTLVSLGGWLLQSQNSLRERERAVAAERDRQEAIAALQLARNDLAAGKLDEAELSLASAEKRVVSDSTHELVALLENVRRDRDLIKGLKEIDDASWLPTAFGAGNPSEIARRIKAVFDQYPLDVAQEEPAKLAEEICSSPISGAMTSGLAEWFCADPKARNLRELLDVLDPNSQRAAVRLAIAEGDEPRVKNLVAALDGAQAPGWFASSIGFYRMVGKEDGARLMTSALRSHPSDYLLAFRCARLNGELSRYPEMLSWAKVTVALRPDSPFAHSTVAHGWRFLKNWDEAEASARKVIELGKKYPSYPAPSVLGNVLTDKGDFAGARDQYLAAINIAPKAHGVYYNAGFSYRKLGEFQKAEEYLRKAIEHVEPDNPRIKYYEQFLDDIIEERKSKESPAEGAASSAK